MRHLVLLLLHLVLLLLRNKLSIGGLEGRLQSLQFVSCTTCICDGVNMLSLKRIKLSLISIAIQFGLRDSTVTFGRGAFKQALEFMCSGTLLDKLYVMLCSSSRLLLTRKREKELQSIHSPSHAAIDTNLVTIGAGARAVAHSTRSRHLRTRTATISSHTS